MAKTRVYISSTFKDLEQHRRQVIDIFNSDAYGDRFDVVSMEGYVAEDKTPFLKCMNDVEQHCDLYILISAGRYGFIPDDPVNNAAGRSVTEMEYDTAVRCKKMILVFLADESQPLEEDKDAKAADRKEKRKKLQAFKQKVRNEKLTHPQGFTTPDNLCKQVQQSIYKLFGRQSLENQNVDKIYFCDRTLQNNAIQRYKRIKNPVQFFLISSHEKDMAHYFVKRIGLDCIESDIKTIDLYIYPAIAEEDSFEDLEFIIQCRIKEEWNRNEVLKKYRLLKEAEEVNIDTVVAALDFLKYDCLLISWEIQSIYWKNNKLSEYITSFYEKYEQANAALHSNKKILFIGIANYVEDSPLTPEEFEEKIRSIRYGQSPIKLTKIERHEIKIWMKDYDIAANPLKQDSLLNAQLPPAQKSFYFCELEEPLKRILSEA